MTSLLWNRQGAGYMPRGEEVSTEEVTTKEREAQERLASFVELAPDGIFVADLEGRYVEVNNAGCCMLGYSRDEIIGMSIVDVIPPDDVERLWRDKAHLLAGGVAVGEWQLRRKDGSLFPAEVSAKILPDGRWQGFVRDISARKRAENAAQQAIRARDEVLGIVAHDLRTPLGMILMQAGLMRRQGAGPERRSLKPLETIERAASRMERLITDLLDVTRMEAGGLSVERSRQATLQLLREAVEAQREMALADDLDLQLEASQELPDVWADRDRLLQVFENLIGNAMKFTDPGGGIMVGAAPREGELHFWVRDTGAGIPADDLPRLFDRFWQGERDARRGAGLGLQIVKGLIEAHGGRIWVESAPGRGTTVFFTIPMAPQVNAWLSGAPSQGG